MSPQSSPPRCYNIGTFAVLLISIIGGIQGTKMDKKVELIKSHIGEFANFPKEGVEFKDIFTALVNGEVCTAVKDVMVTHIRENFPNVDAVVGLEARGFLFSLMIAAELGIGCVPIRKKGKLPGELYSVDYQSEYGSDTFEIQKNSLKPGQKVIIVDDLLATGGTLQAAIALVEKTGAQVAESMVLIELNDLNGRSKVKSKVHSFISY